MRISKDWLNDFVDVEKLSAAELEEIITIDFSLFKQYYSITDSQKKDIHLRQRQADSLFISESDLTQKDFFSLKQEWKEALLNDRKTRVKPNLDDKIITSWNALLVSGYVEAFKASGEQSYLSEAKTIIEQLEKNNFLNGQPMHTFKDGSKKNEGFLDDYVRIGKMKI